MKQLNLKPVAITIPASAIGNLFHGEVAQGTGVVVHIGAKRTQVAVISDEDVCLSHEIHFGIDSVNKKAKELKADTEDFEQYYSSEPIKTIIDEQLVKEINMFMEFYYSRGNKDKIEWLCFVGEGAYLKNLDQYAAKKLNIQVLLLDAILMDQVQAKETFWNNSLYFANVLGVLKGM